MSTITEYIRERLLERVGAIDVKQKTELAPLEILNQEMDWDFLTEMGYGMIMGYFRYGKASESTVNNLEAAKDRLKLYENTGNQEYLRDAANFIMQERHKPSIKYVYFKAVDDCEHAR